MSKNSDFALMLAKDYDPARVANWDDMYIEPKHDGVRVLVTVSPGIDKVVTYYSRNGRALNMFSHLDNDFRVVNRFLAREYGYLFGIALDGEMCSLSKEFGDISGAIHRKNATVREAVFRCFSMMSLKSFERGEAVESQWTANKSISAAIENKKPQGIWHNQPTKVDSHEEVLKLYAKFQKEGHEGAMVKNLMTPWRAERSWAWMKLKSELTLDLPIVGFKEGKGKYAGTLGALLVDNKGAVTPVSGMDDALRHHIWGRQKRYMGKTVEVQCQLVFKSGKLRHPRFKRLRPDKD